MMQHSRSFIKENVFYPMSLRECSTGRIGKWDKGGKIFLTKQNSLFLYCKNTWVHVDPLPFLQKRLKQLVLNNKNKVLQN